MLIYWGLTQYNTSYDSPSDDAQATMPIAASWKIFRRSERLLDDLEWLVAKRAFRWLGSEKTLLKTADQTLSRVRTDH